MNIYVFLSSQLSAKLNILCYQQVVKQVVAKHFSPQQGPMHRIRVSTYFTWQVYARGHQNFPLYGKLSRTTMPCMCRRLPGLNPYWYVKFFHITRNFHVLVQCLLRLLKGFNPYRYRYLKKFLHYGKFSCTYRYAVSIKAATRF